MSYYLKTTIMPFIYLLFMSLIGAGISCAQTVWVQVALSALNVFLYLFIIFIVYLNEGKESAKKLHANDKQREKMIATGNFVEIEKNKEYSVWKGFFMGLIIVAPLLICMVAHLIISLATGGTANGAGIASSIMYFGFFYVFYPLVKGSLLSMWHYFLMLYTVPLVVGTAGLSYYVGAKAMFKQYDIINEQQKEFYGDKR